MSSDWNLGAGAIGYSERGSAKQGRGQEFDLGVYVLTIHSNFKTYVNVPHVNIYRICPGSQEKNNHMKFLR